MNVCTGIAAIAGTEWGSVGTSWWQILGAFLLVGGLLVLVLKGLSRWQARSVVADMRLISVTPLGSRRSLEALRYGDEVLLLYRSEGAMVLIDRRDAEDYESQQPQPPMTGLRERLSGLIRRES